LAGLAEARWAKFWETNDSMWLESARDAERRAESRDPDSAAVHKIEGILLDYEGLYNLAEAEYQRAIELDPNNGDAHRRLAMTYDADHQRDRAEVEYKEAIAKEQAQLAISIALKPTQTAMYELAMTQLYLSENQAAAESLTRALGLPSTLGTPKYDLFLYRGIAYDRLGMREAARRDFTEGRAEAVEDFARHPNSGPIEAAIAYFDATLEDARAKSEADAALAVSREDDDSTRWRAVLTYERLGLRSKTFEALNRATAEQLAQLGHWPDLKDLQNDSRFKNLLTARTAH
jgi:tetratricopeptide (TPR) repeat protein